ncbi:DUF4249 family protein [Chitinophagaceae bacterium MMS25-I14]
MRTAGRYIALSLLAVLLCTVFGNCTKELKLPDINGKPEIVLIGELIAGNPISIRGGQSIPLSSGSNLKFTIPDQLRVTLQNKTGLLIYVNGTQDSFSQSLHTLSLTAPFKIAAGQTYSITAQNDQLGTATCSVQIPNPFSGHITDTATAEYSGSQLWRIRVQLQDNGIETNYYVIEAVKQVMYIDGSFSYQGQTLQVSQNRLLYDSLRNTPAPPAVAWDTTRNNSFERVDIYTKDPNTENIKLSNPLSTNRRILLSDKAFSGQTYTTDVYLDKSSFVSAADSSKGQIIVKIRSVNADYFNFLEGYEMFEPTTGFTSLAQPVKIEGNVNGGMGMVGGVYEYQCTYIFDQWNY